MVKANKKFIRVVDGGGTGFRRADVFGAEVKNLIKIGPVKSIGELISFAGRDLLPGTEGIAYSMAGEIKSHKIVVKSPNIHILDGKNLARPTEQKIGIPCVVGNDMECAIMGMAALLPNEKYFMGITWSSGIGLRVFRNGEILADSEGGHIFLDPSPYAPLCGCGVRGCAESILGGKNIQQRVIAEARVLGIVIPEGVDPCEALNKAYKRKEGWAINIYDLISDGMASFLASKITLLRVPVIIWKGSFAKHALPLIEKDIRSKMRKKLINPKWADEVKFSFSPRPEDDGFIGAARIFRGLTDVPA